MSRYRVLTLLAIGPLFLLIAATCSAAASPQSGDHWHASYSINICDRDEDPLQTFAGGVDTHGDGVIHVHPTEPSDTGENATLVRFFENAGGRLNQRSLELPGERPWQTGNLCPDGRPGKVLVVVNDGPLGAGLDTYVPQDGDLVLIAFVATGSITPSLPSTHAAVID